MSQICEMPGEVLTEMVEPTVRTDQVGFTTLSLETHKSEEKKARGTRPAKYSANDQKSQNTAIMAPKKQQNKMSIGDFLKDECMRATDTGFPARFADSVC